MRIYTRGATDVARKTAIAGAISNGLGTKQVIGP
jgi:hypothetical protein